VVQTEDRIVAVISIHHRHKRVGLVLSLVPRGLFSHLPSETLTIVSIDVAVAQCFCISLASQNCIPYVIYNWQRRYVEWHTDLACHSSCPHSVNI
jgi:hypothetical protein